MSKRTVEYTIKIGGDAAKTMGRLNDVTVRTNKSMGGIIAQMTKFGNMLFNISQIGAAYSKITTQVAMCTEAYRKQAVAEEQLAKVMRNTMGATAGEIDAIKKFASEQQKLGVIGDEVQLAGAKELATYLTKKESLKKLMPVMNDMLAHQYGLNASQEQAVGIAQMVGKVLDGQVGALSRAGYRFDDAQEKILQFGKEEQRVALLSKIVTQYVGGMNEALAATPEGKLKQLANNVGDLHERWGSLFVTLKSVILPLQEHMYSTLGNITAWVEQNREIIQAVVGDVVAKIRNAIGNVFAFIKDNAGAILNLAKTLIIIRVGTIAYAGAIRASVAALALKKMYLTAMEFNLIRVRFGLAAATRLMWGFNAATKANVVGILVAAVTMAVAAFKMFRKNTDGVIAGMKQAKEAAQSYYAQEKSNLDVIFEKLRKTNPKSKERNQLVDELKRMYPDLNAQMEQELRNTNNLATAYETLAASIAKKAKVKGMESALEKLSEKTSVFDMAIEELVAKSPAHDRARLREKYWTEARRLAAVSNGGGWIKEKFGQPQKDLLAALGIKWGESWMTDRYGRTNSYVDSLPKGLNEAFAAKDDIAKIQKFLASYLPDAAGASGGGSGTTSSLADPSATISGLTSGGARETNVYINFRNLIENLKMYPQTLREGIDETTDALTEGLLRVVNSANRAAQ